LFGGGADVFVRLGDPSSLYSKLLKPVAVPSTEFATGFVISSAVLKNTKGAMTCVIRTTIPEVTISAGIILACAKNFLFTGLYIGSNDASFMYFLGVNISIFFL